MSSDERVQPSRKRKASKRLLVGETLAEEAARLEKEIATHPVTRCEPGERSPSSSRPGWSSIPLSERELHRKALTEVSASAGATRSLQFALSGFSVDHPHS